MMERYSRQKELSMQKLQGWKKDDTFQELYSKTSLSNGSKSEGPRSQTVDLLSHVKNFASNLRMRKITYEF